MMIDMFSPDLENGIYLGLLPIHPFNVDLQHPQQKCGAQDLSWSPIFMSIGFEKFCFWYNFVLLLLWTDVIATNIAEKV